MIKNSIQEDVAFEEISSEQEDRTIETATYKINTYGADFTLEVLYGKLRDKEIVVPPFQRKYVWPASKASKLIESFLLGLPVPQIFLYKEEENQDLLVVDGQQRLKTLLYFMNGEFEDKTKFFLRGVKQVWEGKTYDGLEQADKRRLKNTILRATIFQQTDPTDKSSIFEIFERLNTGGMALTQQEVRNCVVRGEINKFLEQLNLYPSWRSLYGSSRLDPRMRDVELILRFLALYENSAKYKKPMKDFISDFMREKREINLAEQKKYSELFTELMDLILREIGPHAFKLKAGINVALFDSICVSLAKVGLENIRDLHPKYQKLVKDNVYLDSISKSTTDADRVATRIKIASQIFLK